MKSLLPITCELCFSAVKSDDTTKDLLWKDFIFKLLFDIFRTRIFIVCKSAERS